jgi:hypothetical protein
MKNKLKELNVDFIGGHGPLTKEEQQAISEFIRVSKEKHSVQKSRKKKSPPRLHKQLV